MEETGAQARARDANRGEVRFASVDEVSLVVGPVMEAIAAASGSNCEVVLHDLSEGDLRHSIYAIINGHVSGRKVGGPSTNLGVEVLQNPEVDHNEFGYRGRTADGRELVSSSVYFRDHQGRIIAALCINTDLSPMQTALSSLQAISPGASEKTGVRELVGPDVSTILDALISEAIEAIGKPPPTMSKADRIEVLRLLEANGVFHIKRAADEVAGRLGVSRVTIYGYLDEVRRGSGT